MLEVIISPAKQMRIARDAFSPKGIPPYPTETERLWRALCAIERKTGAAGLKALWNVNDKLLAENIERLHAFIPVADERALDEPAVAAVASAAVFSYVGIQYRSLAPEVLDLDALTWLQEHLWIVSGFYGCVRPFDAVEPYRLEMGARLAVDGARDLYAFWGDRIARTITAHQPITPVPNGGQTVVNLASVEYAKAVLPHLSSDTQIITCIFGEELRDGKPVQRATASKIARGSMVRWMAERGCEDACELTAFDVGYRFAPELSDQGGRVSKLVFLRA